MKRKIHRLLVRSTDSGELLHRCPSAIRAKRRLLAHPLRALLCDGFLGQFIPKPNLEFTAIEAALAFQLWNVELAMLLFQAVHHFAGDEGGRSENELEGFDFFQLGLQGFESVDRETRRRDLELRSWRDLLFQVVAEQPVDVVDDLHCSAYEGFCDGKTLVLSDWRKHR